MCHTERYGVCRPKVTRSDFGEGLMKRHGLDETQARERILDSAAEKVDLPFVQLQSRSTGQTFRLFLSLDPEQSAPTPGDFNAYGLSRNATIPWF